MPGATGGRVIAACFAYSQQIDETSYCFGTWVQRLLMNLFPLADLTTNQIRPGTGVAQQISVKPVELFFDPITDNAVISYCDLNLIETGAKDPHQTS
jgi:hypothetical protein